LRQTLSLGPARGGVAGTTKLKEASARWRSCWSSKGSKKASGGWVDPLDSLDSHGLIHLPSAILLVALGYLQQESHLGIQTQNGSPT